MPMTQQENMDQPRPPKVDHRRRVTDEDLALIQQCATEYLRLRREADQLSPTSMGRKFGIARTTIQTIYATVRELEELAK